MEERLTLDVDVLDGEVGRRGTWALNEASVEKAERERMLEVVVAIDGRPLTSFGCDGVLCATPTGSTAYAFSAGGPVVWPDVEALLLVPNARARAVRPPAGDLAGLDGGDHRAADAGHDGGARLRRPPDRRGAGRRAGSTSGAATSPVRIARVRTRCRSPTGWWPSSGCRCAASGPAGRGTTAEPVDGCPRPDARSGYASGVLTEIRIRGLGVIDDVTLELGPGLTVVTGETGAGKTMVVTGLHLLFGGRADPARVRAGRAGPVVEGRLRLPADSPVLARAADAGAELDEDGSLMLSPARSAAEGRSRAYLGGRAVPVGVLGELAEGLLAVHGQSDQLRLLRPAEQRARPGPVRRRWVDLVDRHRAAYADWRAAGRRPGRPYGQGPRAGPGGRRAAARAGGDRRGRAAARRGRRAGHRGRAGSAHADALAAGRADRARRAGRRPGRPGRGRRRT